MSLPVTHLSIVDLDENDPYYNLYNDVLLEYQTPPTFLTENQDQLLFDLNSLSPWQPSLPLISLN
ncbi:511_t:CDS:2 [Racocetra fulgida]|uniref:511_t:CDS:1 n=1 Tax=Racocetra fulgida TaxID=60492 RepID=A0A9N9AM11_9GLOM|nr:511_t:CDS:2 [Racocetra fulgida]